jgi:hypothetical protein
MMDCVDVELQLIPTPLSLVSSINALWRWVGEEHLGQHMVAKLL